jgi:transcriptional regulator with XRE-family HTH domain
VDYKKAFGEAVRRIRKKRDFSQEDLAERAGIHRTYVGGVERGERNISLENIIAIADALECNISELFAGLDEELRAGRKRKPGRV